MRSSGHNIDQLLALGGMVLIGWLLLALFGGICRWIASLFARPYPTPPDSDDEDAAAMKVVTRPVQMPGGQWMQREFVWRPCDAPLQPNNIDVHDTTDPKHDPKTCRHCNQKPGYSGVSYRSN